MSEARCKSCRAPIVWIETEKGRMMPLDPEPTEAGRVIIRMGPVMGESVAHIETEEETAARLRCSEPAGRTAFVPHWATCPQATMWRR